MAVDPMAEVEKIRTKLLEKYKEPTQQQLVNDSILYVQKKIAEKEQDKQTKQWKPRYNFGMDFILQSIAEAINTGFALDGVNYVLTGNRMYMPTYKAFKNKLYMVYPETIIDLQLIREGDTYSFAKESGAVIYQHNMGDPFADSKPKPIIGAYCVIKNKRGEFLETLNREDYQKMRDASKTPTTWDKWQSEFYLKSVIKRACKRHFNDVTQVLEEKDNELVGLADVVKASPDKKAAIIAANKAKAEGTANGDQDTGN